MNVADRITAARVARGLTQAEVAAYVGVTERTVRRWESGQSRPRNARLIRLAHLLGIDLGDLA